MNLSSELIGDLIEHLTRKNELFDLIVDETKKTKLLEILENLVPFTRWANIDWDKLENKVSWHFDTWQEQSSCATDCITKLPNSGMVVVVWSNALKPSLSMEIEVFKRNAMQIFDECMDTWVFDPNGLFVLECYHEGILSLNQANAT